MVVGVWIFVVGLHNRTNKTKQQQTYLRQEVSREVVRLGGPLFLHDVLLEGEDLDDGLQVPKRLVGGDDCFFCFWWLVVMVLS
jgi:hypothetical protein